MYLSLFISLHHICYPCPPPTHIEGLRIPVYTHVLIKYVFSDTRLSISKFYNLPYTGRSLLIAFPCLHWLWIFVSFRIFFSDNTSQDINIFCRTKREIFFQNLTLGYMTKTLNQIIFLFLHQNQNIFFSNVGNQNMFFQKKTYPPPFQVKQSVPQFNPSERPLSSIINFSPKTMQK